MPIRLRLTEEEIARFAVRRFEFPGVDIKTRLARYYPHGEIAVHALGHVGAISEADLEKIDRAQYSGTATIGKLGIELAYEPQLHGRNGSREILVNARGRSVEKQGSMTPQLRTVNALPGTDLVLAIDFEVQKVAEEAVWDQRAAIVAIDPQNGDVIALASRPGFDPNLFARGLTGAEFRGLNENIDRPLFNRALRGTYPPGSTIKPLVALAGLTYGVATPRDLALLPRLLHAAGQPPPLPRLEAAGPRHAEHGAGDRAVLRHLLLRPGRDAGADPARGVPGPLRLRRAHRHRRRRREVGASCPRPSGSARPTASRRTRSGSPARP